MTEEYKKYYELIMKILQLPDKKRKLINSLGLKKQRDKNRLFLAEGEKCCDELLNSKYRTAFLVISDSFSKIKTYQRIADAKNIQIYQTDTRTFGKISDTKTPQGIMGIASIHDNNINPQSNFVFLESISDPGNLGTIIRTCDWFGIENILLSQDSIDCYNPKVVRSAMGSLFRRNLIYNNDIHSLTTEYFPGIATYAADIRSELSLKEIDPPKRFGLMFGSESSGLSDDLIAISKYSYKIKGKGGAESLNLAISVAISLYHFVL